MIHAMEKVRWPLDYEKCLPPAAVDMARHFLLTRASLAHNANAPPQVRSDTKSIYTRAWARLPDTDLWGLLGHLIESHAAEWSDVQCQEILKAWVEVRGRNPWQVKLLRFWQRWKQHHRELIQGLAEAGPLSWAQKCRYCETWSANRPIMAPFCGVAEILLGASNDNSQYSVNTESSIDPFEAQRRKQKSDILVVSADASLERFSEFGASRQLGWALEESGLSWSLCQPWDKSVELDPLHVKGVIFWSYRHRSNDFIFHAKAFERACIARHIPVVNSVLTGGDVRHSTILRSFQQAGIRCPRFQTFAEVGDIELPYPLILRVDGIHRGQQMQLVHSADEARDLVNLKRAEFLTSGVSPPPNIAIEFIHIADEQGRFHKCRAYVVGNRVVLRHKTISTDWLVNFASSETFKDSANANKKFIGSNDVDLEVLRRAGLASGSDVTALDYSITRNGDYVFWEANRLFKMNGDKDYDLTNSTSESKTRKRALRDRKLGDALLLLLQERFAHSLSQARP